MWGTDMTQTVTFGEGRAYVFVAVEHANSGILLRLLFLAKITVSLRRNRSQVWIKQMPRTTKTIAARREPARV
jgi:hypothetical protein